MLHTYVEVTKHRIRFIFPHDISFVAKKFNFLYLPSLFWNSPDGVCDAKKAPNDQQKLFTH